MVKNILYGKINSFICEACELCYEKRDIAEKCEKHCNEKLACSLEITKNALQLRK